MDSITAALGVAWGIFWPLAFVLLLRGVHRRERSRLPRAAELNAERARECRRLHKELGAERSARAKDHAGFYEVNKEIRERAQLLEQERDALVVEVEGLRSARDERADAEQDTARAVLGAVLDELDDRFVSGAPLEESLRVRARKIAGPRRQRAARVELVSAAAEASDHFGDDDLEAFAEEQSKGAAR